MSTAGRLVLTWIALSACGRGGSTAPSPNGDGAVASGGAAVEPIELDIDEVDPVHYVLGEDAVLHLAANAAAGVITAEMTPSGLTLGHIPAGGALAQLGLADGDVITRVDGTPLTAMTQLRELYRASVDRGHLELEVTRGGETLRRSYHWRASLPSTTRFDTAWTDADRALAAAVATGVRKIGDDRYEIDALVMKALAEHPELVERCRPSYARRTAGATIADGPSVCRALGIGPYDVIKLVNATDILSSSSLSRALAEVGESDFSISLVRLSEPHLIRYTLVRDVVMDAQLDQAVAGVLAIAPEPFGRRARPRSGTTGHDGVIELDDTHYEIDRAMLATVLDNPDWKQIGRIVPSVRNGEPEGIKLYAIRPSSLTASVGLHNGDTVLRVGGLDLADPAGYPEVVERLRTGGRLTVELRRRGQPVEIEYLIR